MYAVAPDGTYKIYNTPGIQGDDIDVIYPGENFFGANYGSSTMVAAPASYWNSLVGSIILTAEVAPLLSS